MIDRFEIFATTVAQLNRNIQRIKSFEMSELDLKGTHVMCLYCLGKQEAGMSASELAKACGEDKAAISRAVGELASRAYLSLPPETEKRAYRAKIRLTEKGKEALAFVNERVDHALSAVGEALTEKEREEFYQSLQRVSAYLNRYVNALQCQKEKT